MAFLGFGLLVILSAMAWTASGEQEDWTKCAPYCNCKWASGKKAAECVNSGLSSIPDYLSAELQSIDLSNNSFDILPNNAFKNVRLVNLHRIHLKSCGIREVHKDAFKGLAILIELDLSKNKIHTLHPGMFLDNIKLRLIYLNDNPVRRLRDELFSNLTYLQTVDMSNCELAEIGNKTFTKLPSLLRLKLSGNKLTHMKLAAVQNLDRLVSLELHNNKWICDCELRAFRDWTIERNLYSQPTSCDEPSKYRGKFWSNIPPEDFACKPRIESPPGGTSITAETEVTLSCNAVGDPPPQIYWSINNRKISNGSKTTYGDSRYTVKTSGDSSRWANLTIARLRPQDRGEFKCLARSPGGDDERNITLVVASGQPGYGVSAPVGDSWPWIIGLITGLLALVIISIALCCCFCQKKERSVGKKVPGNGLSPNGDIPHHINTEQEKSLLAVTHPVPKTSRRIEVRHVSAGGGTELMEQNRNLLDEGSVSALIPCVEEEHSVDSKDTTPHRSRDKLDNEMYPPDLIAFQSGRGANTSPAGSSASTAVDTSRLPTHAGAQSPIHNPMYHGFGTLPYSRSQSPFSPGPGPVVLPRQGYVTIPRRPRVPSWSSAPTPTLEETLSPIRAEPVYDNLGPRTTADGSSVLSLNKSVDPEPPRSRSNNALLHGYVPFDERGSGILKPLPSPMSPQERQCWPGRTADMKRVGSAEGPIGMTTSTPRPKIAPKPPPKPKKNGPLYEDEGEDGTEV